MRTADPNLLVRLLTQNNAAQVAAAEDFILPGAWVPTVVLVETVWDLKTYNSRTPAALAGAVEFLLKHNSLALQEPELAAAALAEFRTHPELGYTDCLILEAARQNGHLPLGTLDRKLGRLPDTLQLA